MKLIDLNGRGNAFIDDEDFDVVSKHRWYKSPVRAGNYYAVTHYGLMMHRLILGIEKGVMIDHADGCGWNNCRANLRVATQSQNMANAKKKLNATSRFKGVIFDKTHKRFIARITINKKIVLLGGFKNEEMAARAYDLAAKQNFKEFARTNF
jgi:hypothetical protein